MIVTNAKTVKFEKCFDEGPSAGKGAFLIAGESVVLTPYLVLEGSGSGATGVSENFMSSKGYEGMI